MKEEPILKIQVNKEQEEDKGFSEFFEWEERDERIPIEKHMLCGCLAGVIEHCSLLPIDIIKTHQQSSLFRANFFRTGQYILESGGMSKFWRGTSVMIAGCIPAHAIFFSIYEIARDKLD